MTVYKFTKRLYPGFNSYNNIRVLADISDIIFPSLNNYQYKFTASNRLVYR